MKKPTRNVNTPKHLSQHDLAGVAGGGLIGRTTHALGKITTSVSHLTDTILGRPETETLT